jgi:hypothetical protein
MVNRYYSSSAVPTELASGITDSATSVQVAALTGYPASTPFTILVDGGTSSSEVMTVTAVVGTTLTVTRGVDGSTALSHTTGATVMHGVSARDFAEPQEHIAATANIHGVTGSLVGTAAPAFTGGGSWSGSPTLTTPIIASMANATHDHNSAAGGGYLNQPRCFIRRAATMSLGSQTNGSILSTVTLDTSDTEVGADWWSASPDATVITMPFNGYGLAHLSAVFQNAGTNGGVRVAQVLTAGGTPVVDLTATGPGGSSTDWITLQGTMPWIATANEKLHIALRQSSGTAMTIFSAAIGFTYLART